MSNVIAFPRKEEPAGRYELTDSAVVLDRAPHRLDWIEVTATLSESAAAVLRPSAERLHSEARSSRAPVRIDGSPCESEQDASEPLIVPDWENPESGAWVLAVRTTRELAPQLLTALREANVVEIGRPAA